MPEVDIFGTYHIDRPSKVKSELTEFSEGADVFFVEAPREESDNDDEWTLTLRNPIMQITSWILNFLWGILGFLLTGRWGPVDGYVTDVVAQEQEIDIEPVDMNLVRRASDISIRMTILSWFLLLLALALFVLGGLFVYWPLVIWAIVVGFAPIVPFAYGTLSERDERMVENIEHVFSIRDDVENACLVVGHRHMDGVRNELAETDIEVGELHKSKFFRRNS